MLQPGLLVAPKAQSPHGKKAKEETKAPLLQKVVPENRKANNILDRLKIRTMGEKDLQQMVSSKLKQLPRKSRLVLLAEDGSCGRKSNSQVW